jgi:hypothetical protein
MTTNPEIAQELMELGSSLAGVTRHNPFTIPVGYFEGFAQNMLQKIAIDDDLVLTRKPIEDVLSVPEGYFDGLAASILDRIKVTEGEPAETEEDQDPPLSPVLETLRHQQPYTVPAGYFEAIEDALEAKRILTTTLADLYKRPTYIVPEGYFDGLSTAILEKCRDRSAKLVPIWRKRVVRFAVAAVLLGVMALGAVKFSASQSGDSLMAMNTHFSNDEFEKGLEGITNEDIIRYLESTGDGFASLAIADVVNEQELPDEDAYFFEENTLDDFLNNKTHNALNN